MNTDKILIYSIQRAPVTVTKAISCSVWTVGQKSGVIGDISDKFEAGELPDVHLHQFTNKVIEVRPSCQEHFWQRM